MLPAASRRTTRPVTMARHKTSSDVRSLAALATDMLTPLIRATYIATQTGHFGSKISVAPGITQPAISPARREHL